MENTPIDKKFNYRHKPKKCLDSRSPSWRQDRMGKKPYHVTVPLKCLTSPRKSRFNYGTEKTLTFNVIRKVSRRPMSLIILLQQNIHTLELTTGSRTAFKKFIFFSL